MYYWRVFLWENGRKSTEYTKYVVAPIFIEDKLDETLDSGEVILKAMPISTRNAFPPKTKFRLERYINEDYSGSQKTWDFVVEHDDVEEYVGCPDICTHRINLIEASVVSQGMHVDNIALTYELQDVNLNYRTTQESGDPVQVEEKIAGSDGGGFTYPDDGLLLEELDDQFYLTESNPGITNFETTFKYAFENTDSLKDKIAKLSSGTVHTITFSIPKLYAYCGTGTGWAKVAELPTITSVIRKKYTQRAIQEEDGSYTPDNNYEKNLDSTDTIVYLKSYPKDTSSFKEYEGRTKVSNGYIYARKTPYVSYNFTKNIPYYIVEAKWLNSKDDTSKYSMKDEILVPLSCSNSNKHYESVKFDTVAMSESESVFTDESGNLYMSWYEYVINTREGIYLTGATYAITKQSYKCRSYYTEGRSAFIFEKDKIAYKEFATANNISPSVYIRANIIVSDMSLDVQGGSFLMKSKKYSCYDLLMKSLLTLDTRVIDNDSTGLDYMESMYPIIVHKDWVSRLKNTQMYETIFENKNLWEILLQIGYYMHAIPYLEFANDGKDRFVLSFKQLGQITEKEDTSRKITVFNSRNLSDYFSQFDSYVTNLFSPQNEVEEWLVAKTSDTSYLVYNDTAEIKTSRPILEILEFDITYNGITKNALDYVFEESIYQVLTSSNPKKIKPAKGNSLYYKLGTNTITGLNYVPPSKNPGTYYYSLQEICRRLFGVSSPGSLEFNNLTFHIKYKTQDDLRITQTRPDLQTFIQNSSYEKYPHHEQFYGQQDKIVDSERFSANLFGQLIRVGNTEYQRQEYADSGSEKESGDLVKINGDAYYVISTENEYYADSIKQKVTYSKNFNQLSKIVTIPSEPRFYEVSERSKIRREVRIMEFFELSTTPPTTGKDARFFGDGWKNFIKALIFKPETETYNLPNFAYTKFSADSKRSHTGSTGEYISSDKLFPSSEVVRENENAIKYVDAKSYSECIVPLLHFPLHDGIVFEWDMEDNFKSGDYIDTETGKADYYAQQSHRYVDVMGRADLFTFRLFNKSDWTSEQAQALPKAIINPFDSDLGDIFVQNGNYIGLDKDNREEISFNYQINLLHRPTDSDSEDFFTFANLFGKKENPLKVCFLSERQSLFNENINLSDGSILADNVAYSLTDNSSFNAIEIKISTPSGIDLSKVKSIAFYDQKEIGGTRVAYIIKNVSKLPDNKKLNSWWIYPVFND